MDWERDIYGVLRQCERPELNWAFIFWFIDLILQWKLRWGRDLFLWPRYNILMWVSVFLPNSRYYFILWATLCWEPTLGLSDSRQMVNLMKVKMNIPKILNSQTFNKEASVVINKSVLDVLWAKHFQQCIMCRISDEFN